MPLSPAFSLSLAGGTNIPQELPLPPANKSELATPFPKKRSRSLFMGSERGPSFRPHYTRAFTSPFLLCLIQGCSDFS